MDLHFREPEAGEPCRYDLLGRRLLQIGATGLLLPVARENPRDPVRELVLEELHVLQGVVRSGGHRVALEVRPSTGINNVDQRVRLPEVVEELVPQPTPLVCFWNQTGDIEELDGNEPRASLARCVVGLAGTAELDVRASLADIRDSSVRVDRGEGIVRDRDGGECCRSEEGRLADVRFPDDPQLHDAKNEVRPQVPLEEGGRPVTPGRTNPASRACYFARCRRRYEIRRTTIAVAAEGPAISPNSGAGTIIVLSCDVPPP